METSYNTFNFTTGPVKLPIDVRQRFNDLPVSHRSSGFMEMFHHLQVKICKHTGAKHVSLLTGSGTLANEAMIAEIKKYSEQGLILDNGEFGNRIIQQCKRQGLEFISYVKEWGNEFVLDEIEVLLKNNHDIKWIMFVHSESSTGCINDLDGIVRLAKKYNLKVCVDIMSSFCNLNVDLKDVFLATASSGKGVASFAGVAVVFTNHIPVPHDSVPVYLDLGYYFKKDGIPFTIPSNLIFAFDTAVDHTLGNHHFKNNRAISEYLSDKLKTLDNIVLLNTRYQFPSHIFTIIPKHGINSIELGDALLQHHFETSYNSGYLVERNQIQIAVMGEHSREEIDLLVISLEEQIVRLKRKSLLAAG